jgi:hypothetical protein
MVAVDADKIPAAEIERENYDESQIFQPFSFP